MRLVLECEPDEYRRWLESQPEPTVGVVGVWHRPATPMSGPDYFSVAPQSPLRRWLYQTFGEIGFVFGDVYEGELTFGDAGATYAAAQMPPWLANLWRLYESGDVRAIDRDQALADLAQAAQ